MNIVVNLSDAARVIKEYKNLGYAYIGSINQTLDCVTLEFEEPNKMIDIDIEFHEGDFVENNNGKIGYISYICHCDECKKRGFFEPTITYLDGTTDYISNYSIKNVPLNYKQIGIRKFSTEDTLKSKIMVLKEENKELNKKINDLINRNHELVDRCHFYEMKWRE